MNALPKWKPQDMPKNRATREVMYIQPTRVSVSGASAQPAELLPIPTLSVTLDPYTGTLSSRLPMTHVAIRRMPWKIDMPTFHLQSRRDGMGMMTSPFMLFTGGSDSRACVVGMVAGTCRAMKMRREDDQYPIQLSRRGWADEVAFDRRKTHSEIRHHACRRNGGFFFFLPLNLPSKSRAQTPPCKIPIPKKDSIIPGP